MIVPRENKNFPDVLCSASCFENKSHNPKCKARASSIGDCRFSIADFAGIVLCEASIGNRQSSIVNHARTLRLPGTVELGKEQPDLVGVGVRGDLQGALELGFGARLVTQLLVRQTEVVIDIGILLGALPPGSS